MQRKRAIGCHTMAVLASELQVIRQARKLFRPSASRPPWIRESASGPSIGRPLTSQEAWLNPAAKMHVYAASVGYTPHAVGMCEPLVLSIFGKSTIAWESSTTTVFSATVLVVTFFNVPHASIYFGRMRLNVTDCLNCTDNKAQHQGDKCRRVEADIECGRPVMLHVPKQILIGHLP